MTPPSFASRARNNGTCSSARRAERPVAAGWRPMFLIQDLVVPHHVVALVPSREPRPLDVLRDDCGAPTQQAPKQGM